MNDFNSAMPAKLTESAEFLLSSILGKSPYGHGVAPYSDWWVCALLEKRGPMAKDLNPDLNVEATIATLRKKLENPEGLTTLSMNILAQEATAIAVQRGEGKASDRDVMAAVMKYLGIQVKHSGTDSEAETPPADAPEQTPKRVKKETPNLDRYGDDLTQMATQDKLTPVLGREEEIQLMMETLCRSKKRNPALIGPAGVGKTAMVEGLAMRIANGNVPEPLVGCRLISLPASSMTAGAGVVGELEKRMTAILNEAAQDGILLFIDEVHSIMGAGGAQGKNDIASLLKPALARGDLACIVATTDVEYRKHITADAALERRFNPVLINELSQQHTLEILKAFRDRLLNSRAVDANDEVLESLIQMSARFMRGRYFPDKALDLLDHCVASAVLNGKAQVTNEDAQTIVQKKVGMPVDSAAGLKVLEDRLRETNLLEESDASNIIYRLQTTTENLDQNPKSPNAILLLHGEAAGIALDLASVIADSVFGSPKRVVRVDLSGLSDDSHINTLVGSPAGYISHGDPLPHDPVQQTPWCVVLWENIHLCHPSIRTLLTRTMQSGMLDDKRGQTTFFSDVVIIATVASGGGGQGRSKATIGFGEPASQAAKIADVPDSLKKLLNKAFLDQCDLVISQAGSQSTEGERWIKENLLKVTGDRYASRGLEIKWDGSFVNWLATHQDKPTNLKEWESLLDENLNPSLLEILHRDKTDRPRKVVVRSQAGSVIVEPEKTTGE